jgi:hypothetical protein
MAGAAGTAVFFLVDGERLEAQACLLAASLCRHLQDGQRAVAYLREDYAPRLHSFTADVLDAAGVERRLIPDTAGGHRPWTAPYPQGNKILAAAMERDCEVSVFLDTDTVIVRPVDFAAELGEAEIAASVSDYASPATDEESWRSHYALFGLDLPEARLTLRAGRRLTLPPYFNAGVVLFRERDASGAVNGIGRDWLEMASDFDRRQTLPIERAFIDQITLPILGFRRGTPVMPLPQRLNFNIQAFDDAPASEADIAHYHKFGVLWAHEEHGPAAIDALRGLVGRSGVRTFIETFRPHLKVRRMKRHLPVPDGRATA